MPLFYVMSFETFKITTLLVKKFEVGMKTVEIKIAKEGASTQFCEW